MNHGNPRPRTVNVTRYITPLREGGSLPALVEADDGFMYLLKFHGAGQGAKALIAELIGGELARALGLKVPEIVFAHLDAAFGRIEGDEEIQDLLQTSVGLNLGLHYLSGAFTFDPNVTAIEATLASQIVWLDSFLTNVDRTVRNTNMLMWKEELWLIDHGASLYFHHSWKDWLEKSKHAFPLIKNHVLLPRATEVERVDQNFRPLLTDTLIRSIVASIPDDWLVEEEPFTSKDQQRRAYEEYLISRVAHSEVFVKEALYARASLI